MLGLVQNLRRQQLAWIRAILDATGWTQTELARRSNLHPSTLSKFISDPNNFQVLEARTVRRIADTAPIEPYGTERRRAGGLAEEATPFSADPRTEDAAALAVQAITARGNAVHAWTLKSRALENLGYLPGDTLMVDLNAEPADGDVVCAQVYERGAAETVFRVLHKPFLVSASLDPRMARPLLINGDQVAVRGVVVATIRPRLRAAS